MGQSFASCVACHGINIPDGDYHNFQVFYGLNPRTEGDSMHISCKFVVKMLMKLDFISALYICIVLCHCQYANCVNVTIV